MSGRVQRAQADRRREAAAVLAQAEPRQAGPHQLGRARLHALLEPLALAARSRGKQEDEVSIDPRR